MKPVTKLITGITLAASIIAFIIIWTLIIVPSIESVEVVVVKPGAVIHKNDNIKQEDLIIQKRNHTTLVEGYLKSTDIKLITGKQAKQTMVGNEMISVRYIDIEDFVPDSTKGEAIRPIPNQWIYALPATVRRKDKIDVYLVPGDSTEDNVTANTSRQGTELVGLSPEQEIANKEQKENQNIQDQTFEKDRQEIAQGINRIEPILIGEQQEVLDYQAEREEWLKVKGLSEGQWKELLINGDIPLLVDVPVAYAKDGAGNEIQNNGEQPKDETRLSATGTIVNLELLINEEKHRLLMKYISDGYKLYITYN
jgi:hypothetical protein